MLLRLIKTRPMNTGTHAELWLIDHAFGDRHLANVFVLYEHLLLALIYPVTVTPSGIYIRGQQCGWQWDNPQAEQAIIDFLLEMQGGREEIRIDICDPEPYLPGYPAVDYHPGDYGDEYTLIITDPEEDDYD